MITIVIDANIALSYLIPLPYSDLAIQQIQRWQMEQAHIVVPALWRYEVLSGLRKAWFNGWLTFEQVGLALSALKDLSFDQIDSDAETNLQILRWAERIGQMVVYDATYLALADRLGAEFWTADRRLANAAHQAGADWVFLLAT
jgi:predicted nucleic acid-binding protein